MRSATHRPPRGLKARYGRLLLLVLLFAAGISSAQEPTFTFRPSDDGKPTVVHVSMVLIDVDKINSADQNFAANFYYELHWKDPQLAHGGSSTISKPLDAVWNPRVQILNQQKIFKMMSDTVEITPEGEVVYRQRVWGHFSQPLDLREFPMDTQTFEIQLISAKHSPEDVVFVRDPKWESGIVAKFSLADWDILSWKITKGIYMPLQRGPGNSSIALSLEARRKVDYYTMNFILPLIFIVAMSWIAFWVHPTESGTQFSVSVTSMLTLIAYRFAVGGLLPMISYMTRMDYFTFFGTLLVFLTLIEVVVTSTLVKRDHIKAAETIQHWSRVIFPTAFVFLTWVAFFV